MSIHKVRIQSVLDAIDVPHAHIDEARSVANSLTNHYVTGFLTRHRPPDMPDDEFTERWLIGQFLQIVDEESWYVMNTWINIARAYIAGKYPL